MAAVLLALAVLLLAAGPAAAEAPPPLWKKGQNCGTLIECGFKATKAESGLKLIETDIPRGIASDPATGHLYLADQNNQRVVELSAWGDFVKAWGWGVKDGSAELQTCTVETGCLQGLGGSGIGGSGAGELDTPRGVAVDSEGNLYVVDHGNHRVQKFDREGHFLRSWGGGVISGGAAGTGTLSSGSATITSLLTTSKAFEIGQTVTGVGIPANTIIRDLGVGTITLSKPVSASGAAVALTAAEGTGNVPTNERQSVTIGGAPTGGSYTLAIAAGGLAGTITNGSNQITNTRVISEQTVGSFHVGDQISGGGIPPGTTITTVDTATGTLTLSATATSSASRERVSATESTAPIPYNASAGEVQAALEALAAVGAGSAAVSGAAGGPWTVEFKGPLLADTDVRQMSGDPTGLTPSSPANKVTVATLQQGAGKAEVCSVAADCRAGVEGTGNGQFESWPVSSFVSVGPGNVVYVGDKGRIQEFNPDGSFKGTFPDPEGLLGANLVRSLAIDAAGNAYLGLQGQKVIRKLNTNGTVACTATFTPGEEVSSLEGVAVSPNGGFYVINDPSPGEFKDGVQPRVIEFNSACARLEPTTGFGQDELNAANALTTGSACYSKGFGLYVTNWDPKNSFIRAYGQHPDPALCPPPEVAPSIDRQYAASVDNDGAVLKAQIDPHYWEDTTYYLEYGTAPCSEGGCAKQPAPPGSLLPGAGVEEDLTTAGVFLKELSPNTTYHYRFVAQSSGGGPVFGRGGTEAKVGEEASFTTFPAPGAPNAECSNQAFRSGASGALPDCRAYEMVSPVDKAGGDIAAELDTGGPPGASNLSRLDQSSASGEQLSYSSYRAFGEAKSAPFTSQYIARRDAGAGWSSEPISPPKEGDAIFPFLQVESPYKYFSPDLSEGWLATDTEPVLAEGGQAGYPNLYRRDTASGDYEACTTSQPQREASHFNPSLQGVSVGGGAAIFRAADQLSEAANPPAEPGAGTNYQLYGCFSTDVGPREVKLVSVLPDGSASRLQNSGGAGNVEVLEDHGRGTMLRNAISVDGSRVFWTAANLLGHPGTLYLRLNPTQPESARINGAATGKGDLIGPATATGKTTNTKTTLTEVKVKSGKFAVGQQITDNNGGIPAGTTITAIEETEPGVFKFTLSAAATKTKTGVELSGLASELLSNVTAETGEFAAGQEISGPGIPFGTTVLSASPGSLTLSAKATQTKAAVALSATSPCTEAQGKACTLAVSGSAGDKPSRFWGATPSGSQALFEVGQEVGDSSKVGDLYLYDTAKAIAGEDPSTLVAHKSKGVLGFGEDLSRIYFVSEEASPQAQAEGAVEGEPNLYLYEAGEGGAEAGYTFIATLSRRDTNVSTIPSPLIMAPAAHLAQVDAKAVHLAFMSSSAELAETVAGYDNTDQASGEPDAEIYRYSAASGDLVCVSCNRTGARPVGREVARAVGGDPNLWAAAQLPPWETSLYAAGSLSEDGRRLFFESFEALVLADTNGKADVYQWEQAGSGDCDAGDASYVPASNGCVSLISSGKSPADSEFIDASLDGRDAFFTTEASLLPQDPGSIDIYDARAGGGFPPPPPGPVECEGQACQAPTSAPQDPTPASAGFQGAGNVAEGGKPRCARGKVARKGRCVAKHRKRAHKRHNRRSGR